MIAIKGTPRLNDKEALEMTRGRVGIRQTARNSPQKFLLCLQRNSFPTNFVLPQVTLKTVVDVSYMAVAKVNRNRHVATALESDGLHALDAPRLCHWEHLSLHV
jgi:hypothetical protein